MNKHLEGIIIGLNPLHDFDQIQFHNILDTDSYAEIMEARLKNLSFFLTIAKPLVRGGLMGGTIGTIGSVLSGNSASQGFAYGMVMGGYLDLEQYLLRGLYHYLHQQFHSSD